MAATVSSPWGQSILGNGGPPGAVPPGFGFDVRRQTPIEGLQVLGEEYA